MRAIVLEKPLVFAAADIPAPGSPGQGEVLVRPHTMGICGTDVGGYLGKMPFFGYPRIIGHELGVEVLEIGPGVTHLRPGDRCAVEPYLNCGHCFACRRGHTNCCQFNQTFGVMCDGGLRERFLIRGDKLHRGNDLQWDQLALVETLAIGCHACDRGAPQAGDNVLIIGAGPIGLAALEFVKLTGAKICVMDLVESRLEFCRMHYGVEHTIHYQDDVAALQETERITSGDRFPVVIDATGNHHSMAAALAHVAQTGTLVYVGITSQKLTFDHVSMHKPEMTIRASRNAMPSDFTRIIGLIREGQIRTDRWITHRISADRMIGEFPTYTRPDSGVIKAVVDLTRI
ncbi:MAG: zinc-binding alcohol dehydrogenase family protein [Planctomycetaceae bacterium]|nr:MAG: zinc-binding alcohol dehydrogenase family protein [Planctomycetaceae bacterium]